MRIKHWQDWTLLALGVWLFVSPFWMPGYLSTDSTAAWNAYVLGGLVVLFAWAVLSTQRIWEEWVEFALGIWLVISPFVLAFYRTEYGAAWNQIILGVLIAVGSLGALRAYPGERVRGLYEAAPPPRTVS